MKNSEILKMLAQANKKCGYKEYANILDNAANKEWCKEVNEELENDVILKKATEIINE